MSDDKAMFPVSVREVITRLADIAAEEITKVGPSVSTFIAAGKDGDGDDTGLGMVIALGKKHTEILKKHSEQIRVEVEAAGGMRIQDSAMDVDALTDSITPKEDARGCTRHKTFGDCVADHRDFIKKSWRPLYELLAGMGVDFSNVKDDKALRHAIRTAVAAGFHLGQRFAKEGCRGYLGSKYAF